LANIKENKRLCGDDLQVAAQANVQIDAEIGPKVHFLMETGASAQWDAGMGEKAISGGTPAGFTRCDEVGGRGGRRGRIDRRDRWNGKK